MQGIKTIGAVVIGRNEGSRLYTCLTSLKHNLKHIVYVDSGSTDNSLDIAKSLEVITVNLDLSIPFTAARARNEGLTELLYNHPHLDYVQFVDGDCELVTDWIEKAYEFMDDHPDYAIVCGRRRERFPDASLFNKLCDIEWDTPIGEAIACGGDALMRISALRQVHGYRDTLIAGEEPEMCFRLRAEGWKIWRLDQEMTLHDAAIEQFSQWWKRTQRSGHAFAEVSYLHGQSNEKFWVKECQRIVRWGLLTPIISLFFALINPLFLLLLIAYPMQVVRIALKSEGEWRIRFGYGFYNVIGKFAEAIGLLSFWFAKLRGSSNKIIEYK